MPANGTVSLHKTVRRTAIARKAADAKTDRIDIRREKERERGGRERVKGKGVEREGTRERERERERGGGGGEEVPYFDVTIGTRRPLDKARRIKWHHDNASSSDRAAWN